MIVLALDTALGAVTAVAADGDAILAARSEPMERGHQERLAPLVRETMQAAGLAWGALERIGVVVGPGSFTGLRVGLAFGKGLALALTRPLVGLGALDALAQSEPDADGVVMAVIDARRGRVYRQAFRAGAPLTAPAQLSLQEAADEAEAWAGAPGGLWLTGPGAALLAEAAPGARIAPRPAPSPEALARMTRARVPADAPPAPLYLRAPDALTLAERGVMRPQAR